MRLCPICRSEAEVRSGGQPRQGDTAAVTTDFLTVRAVEHGVLAGRSGNVEDLVEPELFAPELSVPSNGQAEDRGGE